MDDEQAIWERMEEEPHNWYSRFLAFRDMGPGRSLLGAVNAEAVGKGRKRSEDAPNSWRVSAKQWEWRKRAEAWDEEQERLAQAACKYARVSERARLLERWIDTQDTIMVAHVSDHGYARADALEQLRGLLDDMAKETGGRVKKQELSGKNGASLATNVQVHVFLPDVEEETKQE